MGTAAGGCEVVEVDAPTRARRRDEPNNPRTNVPNVRGDGACSCEHSELSKLMVLPPGLRARGCPRKKVRASGRCARREGARETMMNTDNQKEPGFTEAGEILFWKVFLLSERDGCSAILAKR